MKLPTAETRPGNPLVLAVLIVAALLMTSIYAREGEDGPLHGTRRGLLLVTTPFAVAGDVIARPFTAVGDWFADLRVPRDELDTLRRQNAQMRAELAKLEEQRQENARLRGLLRLEDAFKAKAIAARVIGRPTDSWEGTILIDRGSADGVRNGTPVVAAQGLLGQVVVVAANSAQVRLITDQASGVAVQVQSTRTPGVVRGSVEGRLSLEFTDPKRAPKVGDVLVSSGMGGAYPKGLVVGDVTKVEPDPAGLSPRVEVTCRVPLADIEEVMALTGVPVTPVAGGIE